MKRLLATLLAVLFAGTSATSFAQEAWLLLYQNGHYALATASKAGISGVLNLGEQVSYGESDQLIGVLSNRTSSGTWVLYLVDKASKKVVWSQAVSGHPVGQLSGPSRDVVLTEQFAYFVTIRYGAGNASIEPNAAGGSFDFNRLSLADGSSQSFPLPKECVNPRVVAFGGIPVVYAWEGYGIWKFNSVKPGLDTVVSGEGEELADIRDREHRLRDTGGVPVGAFADYVPVPGTGVFRLTRYGELVQVLNPDLSYMTPPRPAKKVGFAGAVVRAFPGTFDAAPAVGLVHKEEGTLIFEYVDPATLKAQWRTELAPGAQPYSLFPADNDVFYVDEQKGGIFKLSKNGTTLVWKLAGTSADLFDARILAVSNAN
jgi:hypothetical protein